MNLRILLYSKCYWAIPIILFLNNILVLRNSAFQQSTGSIMVQCCYSIMYSMILVSLSMISRFASRTDLERRGNGRLRPLRCSPSLSGRGCPAKIIKSTLRSKILSEFWPCQPARAKRQKTFTCIDILGAFHTGTGPLPHLQAYSQAASGNLCLFSSCLEPTIKWLNKEKYENKWLT